MCIVRSVDSHLQWPIRRSARSCRKPDALVVDEDQKAVVIADRSEVPFLRREGGQRQSLGEFAHG